MNRSSYADLDVKTDNQNWGRITRGASLALYPVPQSVIDENPNIIQNPGY